MRSLPRFIPLLWVAGILAAQTPLPLEEAVATALGGLPVALVHNPLFAKGLATSLKAGVAALLFTDVGRDGLLKGCNVEATVALDGGAELLEVSRLLGHSTVAITDRIYSGAVQRGARRAAEAAARSFDADEAAT